MFLTCVSFAQENGMGHLLQGRLSLGRSDPQLLGLEEFIAFILVGLGDLMLIYDDFLLTQKTKASSQRGQSQILQQLLSQLCS